MSRAGSTDILFLTLVEGVEGRTKCRSLITLGALFSLCLFGLNYVRTAGAVDQSPTSTDPTFERVIQPFFVKNCFACHDEELQTANLNLSAFDSSSALLKDPARMRLILHRLEASEMPPAKSPRPNAEELAAVTKWLAGQLEFARTTGTVTPPTPKPDRITVRRLNRAEYDNTVRDLFGFDLHLSEGFPQDDSGYGFDNIGDVLSLSPVLMEKYLAAAEKISRTAIFGRESLKPTLVRLRSGERSQKPQFTPLTDYDLSGLSLPNAIHTNYRFPADAEYVFRVNLGGERPPGSAPLQIALWIDGQQKEVIEVDPARIASFATPSEPQQLWGIKQEFRMRLTAGEHWIAAAIPHLYEGLPVTYKGPNPSTRPIPPPAVFKPPKELPPAKIEEIRKEFEKRHAEKIPANSARIGSLELGGPYNPSLAPSIETRKKVYACGHYDGHHNKSCARVIVESLAHRSYRRPVTNAEVNQLTRLISEVQNDSGSFEEGLSVAIQAMLVSPHFLFRIEKGRPPVASALSAAPRLTQHELASRLSYFLWSSMPDDELLQVADRGRLSRPAVLGAQVRRMLRDPKANALVENFGGQWLQVRKLESVKPDQKRFPDFDEYLRMSMTHETQLFFETLIREDRSILDFIDSDYSYLNERLARFYGVPNVRGPEFRKVLFAPDANRGGLLTQGSVLTISSYANRTSPVLRGKWVLENLVGAPPPPPPPDVPNLDEAKLGRTSSMRDQLELHRKNAICASCHSRMDPLGFGLENFDAIGSWRVDDGAFPINASGVLPDGRSFTGPQGLKAILKANPEAFAECLTRKMLTYALGRGIEPRDEKTVRQIVKQVSEHDYRVSSMILGIVNSESFLSRRGLSGR